MRIRRAIIIPVILTLGLAGSSLAGTAAPSAAAHMSSIHVQAQGSAAVPRVFFHT
jgi:hypothetical protein